MTTIQLHREHPLGFEKARLIAKKWGEKSTEKFDMTCSYQEGEAADCLEFSRSGVKGSLKVTANTFELDATLGFLFGAFKDKILSEMNQKLDELITQESQ